MIGSITCVFIVAVLGLFGAMVSNLDNKVENQQAKIHALDLRLAGYQGRITELENDNSDLQKELKRLLEK